MMGCRQSTPERVFPPRMAPMAQPPVRLTDDDRKRKHAENRGEVDNMTHNFNIQQILRFWIRNIDRHRQSSLLALHILNDDIIGLICKFSVKSYRFVFGFGNGMKIKSILHDQIFCQKDNLYFLNFKQKIVARVKNRMYGQHNIDQIVRGARNERDFDEILFSNGLASEHCFVLKNGKLFALGRNHYGQLGVGKRSFCEEHPIRIKHAPLFKGKLVQIKCGYEHSIFLCAEGKVYACGHNKMGQLGLGNVEVSYHIAMVGIACIAGVYAYVAEEIECTRNTSFVIVDGEMYAFGANDCGLLGVGSQNMAMKQLVPAKISPRLFDYYGVMKMRCGVCHIAVLNDNHHCFVWGHALSIGVGTIVGMTTRPTRLSEGGGRGGGIRANSRTRFKSVACGDYHTVLQTVENDFYVMGKNHQQQLSLLGEPQGDILYPQLVRWAQISDKQKQENIQYPTCVHVFGATGVTLIAVE